MDFLRWGTDPWGQRILQHVDWSLFWASLFAGVLFLVAHGTYMIFSAHRKGDSAAVDVLERANKDLPERIARHGIVARAFHWVMAASMFTLLFTAFLPIAGIKFAWVTWHWIAGLVLTASIIFHIIHASFWLDFWSIWIAPRDIPELKNQLLHEMGQDVPVQKEGKYPLGNKLYHLAIVVTGLSVVGTGIMMMNRIRTPIFGRNPFLFQDSTWGLTYAAHGFAGVGLVGLVIAHVYFAIRPEKQWVTRGMIKGWITRREYLEHHDPARWNVREEGQTKAGYVPREKAPANR